MLRLLIFLSIVVFLLVRYYIPWYSSGIAGVDYSNSQYRLPRIISHVLGVLHWLFFIGCVITLLANFLHASFSGEPLFGEIKIRYYFQINFSMLPSRSVPEILGKSFGGEAKLFYTHPNLFIRFIYALSPAARAIIVCYVIAQLRKFFISISIGDAFTPLNALRLKRIALVIIVWDVTFKLATFITSFVMLKKYFKNTDELRFLPFYDVNPVPVFIGISLFVLAAIINEAVKIHEEQRLTI
jgi:hypothetical protein